MLFNSFAFALFLPIVFVLYWTIFSRKDVHLRNSFLLIASYVFYGWWDWKFLFLIALTSFASWGTGLLISKEGQSEKRRKLWLTLNLVLNLGILAVFKYFNFFVDSFCTLFHIQSSLTISIILPVGISFYTFQALSYSIDVYRKEIDATRNWLQFFAFVSFFPQLVAGPIERAKNLLPQFSTIREVDYQTFRSALLLMAWGFFKKIMIADRLAVFVEGTFDKGASGLPMVLGAVFFAFQLYLDFSAYSDIAIGSAKLFGFDLMTNFRRPYLSTSFSNFWKRWHISLSSWFMDYLYIPLGGNRKGQWRKYLNLLIVFAVSGLWHGASWNFVIWGVLNVLFMIAIDPLIRKWESPAFLARSVKALVIFVCYALSLVFFRAKGFDTAITCLTNLGWYNADTLTSFGLNMAELKLTAWLLGGLLLLEVLVERFGGQLSAYEMIDAIIQKIPSLIRWALYIALVLSIVYFGQYGGGNEHSFIYFQF
ncbi:MAG: MBOAT family protein [Paludibacteraceae bacterium]|nr:MBOAT family protein [Paludibacteraceae bacterium]